jgi:hypothetical protein
LPNPIRDENEDTPFRKNEAEGFEKYRLSNLIRDETGKSRRSSDQADEKTAGLRRP